MVGGVFEPPYAELTVDEDLLVGCDSVVPVPLEPLLESVLRSVRNEALDLLFKSLKNEGAI